MTGEYNRVHQMIPTLTIFCSKKIMYGLLKAKSEVLEGSRMSLKHTAVLSEISKAKAKEESPDGMAIRAASDPNTSTSTLAIIAEVGLSVKSRINVNPTSYMRNTSRRCGTLTRSTLTTCWYLE